MRSLENQITVLTDELEKAQRQNPANARTYAGAAALLVGLFHDNTHYHHQSNNRGRFAQNNDHNPTRLAHGCEICNAH